jgi:hypothetical protein
MGRLDENPLAVIDTDVWDWTRFRCAAFVSEEGSIQIFRKGGRDDLHRKIKKWKGRVFSHCGGGHDFLFLPELQNVCLANSSIMRAQCGSASLHDLQKLMPMEMDEIGAAVQLPRIRQPDQGEEVSDDVAIANVTRDAEIGVEAMRQYKAWLMDLAPYDKLPTTSGLLATHILSHVEPKHVAAMRKNVVDPGLLEEMSQAMQGGRVELFWQGLARKVWVYDLNSSYPASYHDGELPIGPWRRVTREQKRKLGIYFCDEIRQAPDRLPLVSCEGIWRRTGSGWLTSEEIEAVRSNGGSVKVRCGWVSDKTLPLGQAFSNVLYPHKQAGLPWAKSALVALHGKFAQGCEQEMFVRDRGRYVQDLSLGLPSWYQQPFLAAFVYGRARLRMGRVAQAILDLGYLVYQLADDAIHTNCPPDLFPAAIGSEIGEWKIAHMDMGGEVEGCYLAPKVYGLRGKNGSEHIVCRGVNPEFVSWDHLIAVSEGEEVKLKETSGLVRFRAQITQSGSQQEPESATQTYTLRTHLGGKVRGDDGRLDYREE